MERIDSSDGLDVKQWRGVVLFVGAADSGKSTLARTLWPRVVASHESPAFIDADMGQGTLGPPTTQTLALFSPSYRDAFPPRGRWVRYFVGSTTPRRHMLNTIVGLSLLVREAIRRSDVILIDTTGLVDPDQGGISLKTAKIEILRPHTVVVLEHGDEVSSALGPLEALGTRLVSLPISSDVRKRTLEERRERRQYRFRRYFRNARKMALGKSVPVIGSGNLEPGRLIGILDRRGFLLALAVFESESEDGMVVSSPLGEGRLKSLAAIRLGDIWLDPETGEHGWIPRPRAEAAREGSAGAPEADVIPLQRSREAT